MSPPIKKHTDTISALDEICNLLYNVSKQIWGIFGDGSPHSGRRWYYKEVHTKDNLLYDYTFHSFFAIKTN